MLRLRGVCSVRTVQRELRLYGLRRLARLASCAVAREDKKTRKKWAHATTVRKLRKVAIWSDGSYFRMPLRHAPRRSHYTWLRPGERRKGWAVRPPRGTLAPGTHVWCAIDKLGRVSARRAGAL